MTIVNMLDAKSQLSRLVEAVETGREAEIIIARNGRPAARLVPIAKERSAGKRLGLLAGKVPRYEQDELDASNSEIGRLFNGDDG